MQLRGIKLRRKALAFVAEYLALEPLELVLQSRNFRIKCRDRLRLRLHEIRQLRRA